MYTILFKYVIIFPVHNMELEILEYLKNNDGTFERCTNGLYLDDEITYDIEDYTMHINPLKHIMIRESKDYKYIFDLDNSSLKCILKNDGLDLDMDLNIIDMNITNDIIYLKYYVSDSDDNVIEYKLTCTAKKN